VDIGKTGDDFKSLDNALKQLAEPVLLDNIAIELDLPRSTRHS
jgi:hypothetical protein